MNKSTLSRRRFLKNALAGTAGMAAYATTGLQVVNAATQNNQDYKALVCVFLYGGNDAYNLFHPMRGDARAEYEAARSTLARPPGLEIFPANTQFDGGLGFDSAIDSLKPLFDSGKLAIQGNVGGLIEPVLNASGAEIAGARLPQGLFAHDASQQNWMRGADLNQQFTGWGGRLLDLLESANNDNAYLRNMSLSGGNFWQTGVENKPYSVDASGSQPMRFINRGRLGKLREESLQRYHENYENEHVLGRLHSQLLLNSVANNAALAEQLAALEADESQPSFPNTSLGQQLSAVSRLIQIGKSNGLKRQVFFVAMGGFDTHDNQAEVHPGLSQTFSDAMAAFYQATETTGIANEVTSFTMSDFGRTIRSNGNGTDHGWGSHHFILGGAVNGGQIYGDMPYQTRGTHLAPTTANEQMFASLARWFGVTDSVIGDIFPNLNNFDASGINYFSV